MKLRSLLAVPLLLLGSLSAPCAVVVTVDTVAPSDDIILSNFPNSPATGLSESITGSSPTYLNQGRGQQFQVTEDVLLQSLSIYTGSAYTGGSFILYIDRFTGTETAGPYEVISEQTGMLPSSGVGNRYIHFTLGEEVLLQTGGVYGFRLGFEPSSASIAVTLRSSTNAPSTPANTAFGQQFYTYKDGAMQKVTWNNSLQIAYYLTGTPAPVPEPGAAGVALLGGAVLGAFFLFGRRRK